MTYKLKKIKINKNNQKYLINIIKKFPKINSGRKNYRDQYNRVLKNLLLAQAYNTILKKKKEFLLKDLIFHESNNSLTIKFNI